MAMDEQALILGSLLDNLAAEVMVLEAGDLMTYGDVLSRLEQLLIVVEGLGSPEMLELTNGLKSLMEGMILGQVPDQNQGVETLTLGVSLGQTLLRGESQPGEVAQFLASRGLAAGEAPDAAAAGRGGAGRRPPARDSGAFARGGATPGRPPARPGAARASAGANPRRGGPAHGAGARGWTRVRARGGRGAPERLRQRGHGAPAIHRGQRPAPGGLARGHGGHRRRVPPLPHHQGRQRLSQPHRHQPPGPRPGKHAGPGPLRQHPLGQRGH